MVLLYEPCSVCMQSSAPQPALNGDICFHTDHDGYSVSSSPLLLPLSFSPIFKVLVFSVEKLLVAKPSHCRFLSTGLSFDRKLTRRLKGLWIYLVFIIVYVACMCSVVGLLTQSRTLHHFWFLSCFKARQPVHVVIPQIQFSHLAKKKKKKCLLPLLAASTSFVVLCVLDGKQDKITLRKQATKVD